MPKSNSNERRAAGGKRRPISQEVVQEAALATSLKADYPMAYLIWGLALKYLGKEEAAVDPSSAAESVVVPSWWSCISPWPKSIWTCEKTRRQPNNSTMLPDSTPMTRDWLCCASGCNPTKRNRNEH